ncbi:hypothetical protein EDD16DRAFT_1719116 [Pisolithus croceorrhizus]|nr:hypothetical protein EDD16DRAFT_1719116 [Pisolithus croceorrhizus]
MAPRKHQIQAGSDAAILSNSDFVTPASSIPAATDQIPKEDNNELTPVPSSTALQCTTEFFGALSNHGPGMESEASGSEGEEVIDINIDDDNCNNSDILSSESKDGNIIRSGQWQCCSATKPVQRPVNLKNSATSKGKAVAKSASLNYNPEMCAFDIQCAVCLPDGGNSLFKILSMVTLDELHIAISEKLHHFLGLVSLCYWLDSDKAKFGATSIQSEEELDLFKTQMHGLIIPQYVSTVDTKNPSMASNGNKAKLSSPSGMLEGTNHHQKLIEDLQKHWRCEKHSKGLDSLVFCYSPSGVSVCYPLTHSNISYWALEIMDDNDCGRVMIDKKPSGIRCEDARPHTCSSAPPVQVRHPPTILYPSYLPPIFVLPPWGPPGFQGGNYAPMQPTSIASNSSHNAPPSNPSASEPEIPDIISWLVYLDQHKQWNKDGIVFSQFRLVLQKMGFVHISQLSLNFIKLLELQDLLGINLGTAISLMQYARDDLEAVKSGQWTFPKNI